MRFDEVELEVVPLGGPELTAGEPDPVVVEVAEAPRFRRLLALLTDLSLLAALALALSPLLSSIRHAVSLAGLCGFVLLVSFYYFAGTWLLWGRTIGGVIFDVRVVSEERTAMSLREAALRWTGVWLSLLTCGIGFLLAALPSRRSLADRISGTRCVSA